MKTEHVCPLLKWQDTVNGSPLEILESMPGMVRAAAHECEKRRDVMLSKVTSLEGITKEIDTHVNGLYEENNRLKEENESLRMRLGMITESEVKRVADLVNCDIPFSGCLDCGDHNKCPRYHEHVKDDLGTGEREFPYVLWCDCGWNGDLGELFFRGWYVCPKCGGDASRMERTPKVII